MATVNLTGLRQTLDDLAKSVEEATGQKIRTCYQCGECTGGCPVAYTMDFTPRQIMRFLQLGQLDKALESETIWTCAGCSTCSARCPREVDLAAIMDYLRSVSYSKGVGSPVSGPKDTRIFHGIFLDLVRRTGRLYEVGLIGFFNLKSRKLLQDVDKAPSMFLRGKLGLLPHVLKGRTQVASIFERVKEMEGKGHE